MHLRRTLHYLQTKDVTVNNGQKQQQYACPIYTLSYQRTVQQAAILCSETPSQVSAVQLQDEPLEVTMARVMINEWEAQIRGMQLRSMQTKNERD